MFKTLTGFEKDINYRSIDRDEACIQLPCDITLSEKECLSPNDSLESLKDRIEMLLNGLYKLNFSIDNYVLNYLIYKNEITYDVLQSQNNTRVCAQDVSADLKKIELQNKFNECLKEYVICSIKEKLTDNGLQYTENFKILESVLKERKFLRTNKCVGNNIEESKLFDYLSNLSVISLIEIDYKFEFYIKKEEQDIKKESIDKIANDFAFYEYGKEYLLREFFYEENSILNNQEKNILEFIESELYDLGYNIWHFWKSRNKVSIIENMALDNINNLEINQNYYLNKFLLVQKIENILQNKNIKQLLFVHSLRGLKNLKEKQIEFAGKYDLINEIRNIVSVLSKLGEMNILQEYFKKYEFLKTDKKLFSFLLIKPIEYIEMVLIVLKDIIKQRDQHVSLYSDWGESQNDFKDKKGISYFYREKTNFGKDVLQYLKSERILFSKDIPWYDRCQAMMDKIKRIERHKNQETRKQNGDKAMGGYGKISLKETRGNDKSAIQSKESKQKNLSLNRDKPLKCDEFQKVLNKNEERINIPIEYLPRLFSMVDIYLEKSDIKKIWQLKEKKYPLNLFPSKNCEEVYYKEGGIDICKLLADYYLSEDKRYYMVYKILKYLKENYKKLKVSQVKALEIKIIRLFGKIIEDTQEYFQSMEEIQNNQKGFNKNNMNLLFKVRKGVINVLINRLINTRKLDFFLIARGRFDLLKTNKS